MAQTFRPKFLRYEDRPDNTGDAELARAQPVYIHNLPGPGFDDLVASAVIVNEVPADGLIAGDLQTVLGVLSARIKTLEDA